MRSIEQRQLAHELGLQVSCLGASFDMPARSALDHEDNHARRQSIDHVRSAIDHASQIGAGTAYVIPGLDTGLPALRRYGEALLELADHADNRGVKLAVEHFPGRALSTASETLTFIKNLRHDNLYLLYDSGHIQMTDEKPADVIHAAGDRLGYVHFDDNDGKGDLHLALLDGVLSECSLSITIQALREVDYGGALSLELNPALPNIEESLRRSRDILLRALSA